MGGGLLFGLAGDVFLMFDDIYPPFFIYGLVAFLIGHLLYMSAFYLDYKVNKGVYKKHSKNAIIAYGFFSILFCAGLWNYLGDMKIPVILYAIVISLMGVMAVNRFGRVNSLSFKCTFYGSILFVLSDSVLAIHRFVDEFKLSGMIVMASYMAAQYLITMGNIERKMKKRVEEI
ncbi:MAG: lysoplasmalogenase [Chitinophagaceae bacterium]|nr:MAG: lysoplasmalogenase [Chitinophagaceae bacterium]